MPPTGRNALAREFPHSMISKAPFPNDIAAPSEEFQRLEVFLTRLMVNDSVKGFVPALDPKSPNSGYSWYAGI